MAYHQEERRHAEDGGAVSIPERAVLKERF